MKNIDILSIVTAYQKADGTLTLPARVAWTRRVNMKKLAEAKTIIDEAMQELQEKYIHEERIDKNGEQMTVKPEFMPDFVREQSEILTQETDVDIKKISIEDLGDIAVTDAQMDTLAFMIEE